MNGGGGGVREDTHHTQQNTQCPNAARGRAVVTRHLSVGGDSLLAQEHGRYVHGVAAAAAAGAAAAIAAAAATLGKHPTRNKT